MRIRSEVCMLYIGVDLGTSAVKLLLMDEKGGIKKIVSKYNGNISFSSNVEEFVVNISIPIPQNLN